MKNFAVVLPIFNDWTSFQGVLSQLDRIAGDKRIQMSVFAVNDGSTIAMPDSLAKMDSWRNLAAIEAIDLVCNMGHQRAIAVGLCEVMSRSSFDAVIVMDADGEDDPKDIPALLDVLEKNPGKAVLAHRATRSEGSVFKVAYQAYKLLFRLLTGYKISFGNYCVLPQSIGKRLTFNSNLWNSLPATVLLSRSPYVTAPTHRAKRLDGKSQMNFVALIVFGLDAITVFSDAAMVRLGLMIGGLIVAGAAVVSLIRLTTDIFLLGWTSLMLMFLFIIGIQVLFLLLNTSMLILRNRSLMQMVPAIQYKVFIQRIVKAIRTAQSVDVKAPVLDAVR